MCEQTTPVPVPDQPQVEYCDVPGFPGYRVGDDGSVWSCWTFHAVMATTWHRLAESLTGGRNGKPCYPTVTLVRDRRKYSRLVHILILTAFVGPCPDGMEACHENGDPTDNRRGNLRWDTHAANEADRARHGNVLRGSRNGFAKLTEDDVILMRQLRARGWSLSQLARRFRISKAPVGQIIARKAWTHVP